MNESFYFQAARPIEKSSRTDRQMQTTSTNYN